MKLQMLKFTNTARLTQEAGEERKRWQKKLPGGLPGADKSLKFISSTGKRTHSVSQMDQRPGCFSGVDVMFKSKLSSDLIYLTCTSC